MANRVDSRMCIDLVSFLYLREECRNLSLEKTSKIFKVIECADASKVPFTQGQYIIEDDGTVFYDPSTGTEIANRVCLSKRPSIHLDEAEYPTSDEQAIYDKERKVCEGFIDPDVGDIAVFVRYRDAYVGTGAEDALFCRSWIYLQTGSIVSGQPEKVWVPMYNKTPACDVIYDEDIIVTTAVGNITLTNGKGVIPAKGKTAREVWEAIFSQDKNPTVTQPSASIKMGYDSNAVDTSARSFEVGTSITPKWQASFSAGSYSYGPATNVTVSSWAIKDTLNNSATAASGSFSAFTITAGQTYRITATATHTAGATPKTALEKDYTAGKIAAGTKSATSQAYTGYRQGYFIGSLTSKVANASLTSAQIRSAQQKRGANYAAGSVTWTIPVGAATVFIAWPATSTGPTKILNTTVNADMTAAFGSPSTIKVAGADGSTSSAYAADYKVISYRPDSAYGTAANLTITMG